MAQFVRIITNILQEYIPKKCRPFLDNVGVLGPRSTYNNVEDLPGIRKFVRIHIQWLDAVLASLERAGYTVSRLKSQWLMNRIKIVSYICSSKGRMPEVAKVIKILEWPPCNSIMEA